MPPLTPGEQAVNARIEAEGLHIKHDTQLVFMRDSHATKILRVAPDLDRVLNFPDSIRWELKVGGDLSDAKIEQEVLDQRAYYQWKFDRLTEIVSLIDSEIRFRADDKVRRNPVGTTYYIDSDNGDDANDGLGTGTAWRYLDKFTEAARSAGDKAILRRGMTNRYDDGTDLLFTSDGTVDNPIIAEADSDDAFSDQVDLSVTATATLTFGSKTVTFSADVSSVVAAGDWIYASSDDNRVFAYEVDSVSTVTVTLFLPYKGDQAGAGKTMFNMQSTPIWNTAAGNFQAKLDSDDYWKFQCIHFRGTDTNGAFEVNNSALPLFKDCVFEGNGASDYGLKFVDDWIPARIDKCRFYNYLEGIGANTGFGGFIGEAGDCLFDGNSVANSRGMSASTGVDALLTDCELKNHGDGDVRFTASVVVSGTVRLRNCILASTTELDGIDVSLFGRAFIEDHDGTPGDTRQLTYLSSAEATPIIQSETTTVRSGGSTISIKVTPSTDLSSNWEHSRQKLFDLAFYATTDSKQYDVYFRPTATADWTADPVAGELWIEAEYWGHASNNFRRILKSTGVIDMNGSTAWAALSVTVMPAQAGVLYLRAYYAKTKESSKANTFFCDPIPVVT